MPAVENLTIKLTGAVACLVGTVSCVWWAATVTADLRTLVQTVTAFTEVATSNQESMRSLATRLEIVDKNGTEALGVLRVDLERVKERVTAIEHQRP